MLTKEKIQHHIQHLQEKHDDLDNRIKLDMEAEYIMRVLKKEKLALRDEIENLKHKMEML